MSSLTLNKPAIGTWHRIKQVLLGPHQDQTTESDNLLTEKIRRALGAARLLRCGDAEHIRIVVSDGKVSLAGHVVRSMSKAQAETATREVPGVEGVVNHLVVDHELMIDVAHALGQDQNTKNEHIQVSVQHGVVYLSGSVSRKSVQIAAVQAAAGNPHARAIINRIQSPGIAMDIDEEQVVQPRIGASCYAAGGQVGRVQQVIINPLNRRVTAVVIHRQLDATQESNWTYLPGEHLQLQCQILVPVSSIWCAPSGLLRLNVSSSEATHLADFDQCNFVAPPTDWQPPFPYLPRDVLFDRI